MKWIGKRVRDLRLARGLPLRAVWRDHSYLLRLENGKLTPRLLNLEKIADRIGVGLWRFFVSDDEHERLLMLEDSFVVAVKLYMNALTEADRARILEALAAAPKVP